jgi:hypothetical protein
MYKYTMYTCTIDSWTKSYKHPKCPHKNKLHFSRSKTKRATKRYTTVVNISAALYCTFVHQPGDLAPLQIFQPYSSAIFQQPAQPFSTCCQLFSKQFLFTVKQSVKKAFSNLSHNTEGGEREVEVSEV